MKLFIGTSVKTSGMSGTMRSGYFKQGIVFVMMLRGQKFKLRITSPVWIPHKYNKFQVRWNCIWSF